MEHTTITLRRVVSRQIWRFIRNGLLGMALSGLIGTAAMANPTGPNVVHGNASISHPSPGVMQIRNAPGTIIEWQGFSIGADELTRFIQRNRTSAVLNRVTGQNPSRLLGQLVSNGRVFLINRNGVVFGQNARINTAGLVVSTLNMTNEDFLNKRYRFQGEPNAGDVINHGFIQTGKNGNVLIVAPNIENHGVIRTDGGQLILAAGHKVSLTSLNLKNVAFELQAPDGHALNLGKLIANGGAVGVFADTIDQGGAIQADSIVRGPNGEVRLVAGSQLNTREDSVTRSREGRVLIQSDGETRVAGTVDVSGDKGGTAVVLGDHVTVANVLVDASGTTGGGKVLIGGNYQGKGLLPNAVTTTIDKGAVITADATDNGDGGRIIAWSDGTTAIDGALSARGGLFGGDGGFVETSGREKLSFHGDMDVSASNGAAGTWLLDPKTIVISDGFVSDVDVSSIEHSLDDGTNVTVLATDTLSIYDVSIDKSSGNDAELSLGAGDYMWMQDSSIESRSDDLDVLIVADYFNADNSSIETNGGKLVIGASAGIGFTDIDTDGGEFAILDARSSSPAGIYVHDSTIETNDGDLEFKSNHSSIYLDNNNINTDDGDITLDADTTLTSMGDDFETYDGDIQLESDGYAIDLNGTQISTRGGDVEVDGYNDVYFSDVSIESNRGNLNLDVDADLFQFENSSSITTDGGDINIRARTIIRDAEVDTGGGAISIHNDQPVDQSYAVPFPGVMIARADIDTSGGDLELVSSDANIWFEASHIDTGDGDLTATAGTRVASNGSTLESSSGDIKLVSRGDTPTGGYYTRSHIYLDDETQIETDRGDITLASDTNVHVYGVVHAKNGDVDIAADRAIEFHEDGTVIGNNVSLEAGRYISGRVVGRSAEPEIVVDGILDVEAYSFGLSAAGDGNSTFKGTWVDDSPNAGGLIWGLVTLRGFDKTILENRLNTCCVDARFEYANGDFMGAIIDGTGIYLQETGLQILEAETGVENTKGISISSDVRVDFNGKGLFFDDPVTEVNGVVRLVNVGNVNGAAPDPSSLVMKGTGKLYLNGNLVTGRPDLDPLQLNTIGNFATSNDAFQPTIQLTGSGLDQVDEIIYEWTDPLGNSGTVIWNQGNNFGGGRYDVDSYSTASISPVLVANGDPEGVYEWTVMFVAGGQQITRTFSVDYDQIRNWQSDQSSPDNQGLGNSPMTSATASSMSNVNSQTFVKSQDKGGEIRDNPTIIGQVSNVQVTTAEAYRQEELLQTIAGRIDTAPNMPDILEPAVIPLGYDAYLQVMAMIGDYHSQYMMAIIDARRLAREGKLDAAKLKLEQSEHLLDQFNFARYRSQDVYLGGVEDAITLVSAVKNASVMTMSWLATPLGPQAVAAVEAYSLALDFAVKTSAEGWKTSTKSLFSDIVANVCADLIMKKVPVLRGSLDDVNTDIVLKILKNPATSSKLKRNIYSALIDQRFHNVTNAKISKLIDTIIESTVKQLSANI